MEETFIAAFISLFVIIDPVGLAPIFGSLTQDTPVAHQRKMALLGSFIGLIILVLFAVGGESFLRALGISMDALKIAGGIMLFIMALEMVFEKRGERKQEAADKIDEYFDDVSVFPVAMPLVAGPGAITTIMLLMAHETGNIEGQAAVLAALLVVMLITLLVFFMAGKVMKFMGPSVSAILTRLLGMILAALAAQFIIDGTTSAFLG
ncbi:MAG: MarC family protein [Kordiimonadaceae bacterium]|nr:MarC family protein [Kordiimonadaceae bacterium]